MSHGVSIIICCYNSATRIKETIRHVAQQKFTSSLQWEVLLVNNASTDNTVDEAKLAWSQFNGHGNFRIVHELMPGLSSARQKGIAESRYDILIFCDDDNHLDLNYVERAYLLMSQQPEVGVAGCWCKPKLPNIQNSWIRDFYPALAIGKQAEQSGYVDWVFGAGMVIRKAVFEELKKKNIKLELTDRVGSKQTSGGDSEICAVARFTGYKVFFSEDLMLHHEIALHRLTAKSFIRANYRNVFPLIYLYLLESLMNNSTELTEHMYKKYLVERVRSLIYFLPRLVFGRHRFYSFMMFYQNVQLFYWLLTRKGTFEYTAIHIKKNLYHDKA